jgi:hypothetical protein
MEVHITIPSPKVQPRRLVDIMTDLDHNDAFPERWLQGVTWEPRQCRFLIADAETDCDPEEMPASLTPAECATWETQPAFRLSDAWKGSTLDLVAEEDLADRYRIQFGASIASELLSGDASGGISLSSEATAPTGFAFTDPAKSVPDGFGLLESEIAERLQGGVGYIHVSPMLHNRLVAKCGVRINAEGNWESPAGNIVITDAGYINPPKPSSGPASGAATDWMYASGPVVWASTAPSVLGLGSTGFTGSAAATPWNRNQVTRWLTGYAIVAFDPCPVTAIRVGFNEADDTWNS